MAHRWNNSNFIDLNTSLHPRFNYLKPLILLPKKNLWDISNIHDNPFDVAVRTVQNYDDPFEIGVRASGCSEPASVRKFVTNRKSGSDRSLEQPSGGGNYRCDTDLAPRRKIPVPKQSSVRISTQHNHNPSQPKSRVDYNPLQRKSRMVHNPTQPKPRMVHNRIQPKLRIDHNLVQFSPRLDHNAIWPKRRVPIRPRLVHDPIDPKLRIDYNLVQFSPRLHRIPVQPKRKVASRPRVIHNPTQFKRRVVIRPRMVHHTIQPKPSMEQSLIQFSPSVYHTPLQSKRRMAIQPTRRTSDYSNEQCMSERCPRCKGIRRENQDLKQIKDTTDLEGKYPATSQIIDPNS